MSIRDEVLKYIETNWPKTTRDANDNVPYPFTSPSSTGFYLNFYYWDNYFFNKGLLLSGLVEQVKNNINNITYYINKYGYMPNADCLLNRTQPPVYPLCVWDLYEYTKDINNIKIYMDTILKEYYFFQTKRMTPTGLNAFMCSATDESLRAEYRGLSNRVLETSDDPNEQLIIAKDILAIAESGLDFNMRFRTEKSKIAAHEFSHLDINCFLYKDEITISKMLSILGRKEESERFLNFAKKRQALMNKYFYDEEQGMFVDYNFVKENHSHVITAVSLYPHAFGVTKDKESALKVLKQIEFERGVSAAAYRGDDIYYQWDYPVLWGETSYIVYKALKNVGADAEAKRIKDKYMSVIEEQFEKTHELWEKYNSRDGSIMNVEYGAPQFMGWTAAMYQWFATIDD